MIYWLIGVAVALAVWAWLWQTQPKLAFGILLGLPLAWIASRLAAPFLLGEQEMPVWLPPLPFAIVAVTLLVFGVLVWFRGAPSLNVRDDEKSGEH